MSTVNLSDKKKEIIELIQRMSGEYSVYQIFDDWISMFALATAQHVQYSDEREKSYLQIVNKHSKERLENFCRLNAMLIEAFEEGMEDVLGYIYMHLELGSSRTGQFFTPYHVCRMMAKIALENKGEQEIYTCNEPSCGGGGNIIAFAEALKEKGINYQLRMKAVCQDIDVRAVYMCYLQCTFYGIPAVVFQSNTLADPNGEKSSTGKMLTFGYIQRFWNRLYQYT
ncbi:MAG: N-6 DNA methylase [Butyrivibrio sp.]|nr:N-6 DNA methylase [Butyrivibrio sp.]